MHIVAKERIQCEKNISSIVFCDKNKTHMERNIQSNPVISVEFAYLELSLVSKWKSVPLFNIKSL